MLPIADRSLRPSIPFSQRQGDIEEARIVPGPFGYLAQCPHVSTSCPTCGDFYHMKNKVDACERNYMMLSSKVSIGTREFVRRNVLTPCLVCCSSSRTSNKTKKSKNSETSSKTCWMAITVGRARWVTSDGITATFGSPARVRTARVHRAVCIARTSPVRRSAARIRCTLRVNAVRCASVSGHTADLDWLGL